MTAKIKLALQRFYVVPMDYTSENMRICREAQIELGRLENLLEQLRTLPNRRVAKLLRDYDSGHN